MLQYYANLRAQAQEAGLWFEVRHWQELPLGYDGTPSHWASIAYINTRSAAGILADSLQCSRGWWCEVWTCNPAIDADIYTGDGKPIAWHLCDRFPRRTYPSDLPGRPSSGNPDEKSES